MPTNSRESKVPVALSQGRILQRMLRLNSVSVSVILVIVLGTYLISPDVQSYLNQRREIVEMEQSIQLAKDAADAFGVRGVGLDDERTIVSRRSKHGFGSDGGYELLDGSLAQLRLRQSGYVHAVFGEVVEASSDLAKTRYETSIVRAKAEEGTDLVN